MSIQYIGQDTEFFIFDTKKGRVVPAHTVGINKSKKVYDYYGSYFRDGYALEINGPPQTCRSGLWENMAWVMGKIKHEKLAPSLKLITDPSADIDLEELQSAPADLKVLGCNPTFCAYAGQEKVIDVDPLKLNFRTTGAHLHFSFNRKEGEFIRLSRGELAILAKYCDLVLGLPFTVIYGDDKEFRRRTLYGQAGEFREQKYPNGQYGFEYRVLSSRLYNHPGIYGLFVALFKYTLMQYQKLLDSGWNKNLDKPLRRAINTGFGAKEIMEEFSSFLKGFNPYLYEKTGMRGLGYIPEDWAAAIFKLRDMRQTNSDLDRFQMYEGQQQAHWGWAEYNDHKTRASTVSHQMLVKEEPWNL